MRNLLGLAVGLAMLSTTIDSSASVSDWRTMVQGGTTLAYTRSARTTLMVHCELGEPVFGVTFSSAERPVGLPSSLGRSLAGQWAFDGSELSDIKAWYLGGTAPEYPLLDFSSDVDFRNSILRLNKLRIRVTDPGQRNRTLLNEVYSLRGSRKAIDRLSGSY